MVGFGFVEIDVYVDLVGMMLGEFEYGFFQVWFVMVDVDQMVVGLEQGIVDFQGQVDVFLLYQV